MKVLNQPKPQLLLSTFLAFYIVHDMQIGVGIQSFQRLIFLEAGHDAWIAVVIAGIVVHIITFLILKTLQFYGSTDIFGIHHDIFGRIIGKVFNAVFIIYCLIATFVILENYIEVVQAWVFSEIPSWFLSLTLLMVMIYGISGGIRVIVGICFFNVVFTFWLVILLMYPLKYANFSQLLPIFETNPTGMLKGVYNMTLTVLGFEILYVIYPHFKEKGKVQKFTQLGLLLTHFAYVAVIVISLIYFSPGQLEEDIWPTLSLFKIVKVPFIERFEYVTVVYWMLIILPNLMFYLWAAIRGLERGFNIGERKSLWTLSILIFIAGVFFKTRLEVNKLNELFVKGAFIVAYCYPIFLYLLTLVKKKWMVPKEQKS